MLNLRLLLLLLFNDYNMQLFDCIFFIVILTDLLITVMVFFCLTQPYIIDQQPHCENYKIEKVQILGSI